MRDTTVSYMPFWDSTETSSSDDTTDLYENTAPPKNPGEVDTGGNGGGVFAFDASGAGGDVLRLDHVSPAEESGSALDFLPPMPGIDSPDSYAKLFDPPPLAPGEIAPGLVVVSPDAIDVERIVNGPGPSTFWLAIDAAATVTGLKTAKTVGQIAKYVGREIVEATIDAATGNPFWRLLKGKFAKPRKGVEVVDAPPKKTTSSAIPDFNPADFFGKKAITPPHLPAGVRPALVIDGKVYVARMHIDAWELAGKKRVEQFYGLAEIDEFGNIIRLFK